VRQDLLEQAKQESEYNEEKEEDRLTEPRSEEEESAQDLADGDYIDENMADDLGDIVNDSLSLEDNFTDAGVSSHLTQKEAKRARNIEETGEEPLSKKIKREGGRADDFNISSEEDDEPDLAFYMFNCELCDIALQSKDTLFMHMLNDHFSGRLRQGNKNSLESGACYECYTEFSDQDKLITHLAKKHDKLNNLLEEYGLQRIEVGQEEGDEGSGSEDLEEENVNLNGSEGVKMEKKYGCTQDLINDIDQLIGKAAQDDVTPGEECTTGAARDQESKSKVGKEPEVGGSRIPQLAKPALSLRRKF